MKVDPELSTLAPPTRYSDCSREEKGPKKKKAPFEAKELTIYGLEFQATGSPRLILGSLGKRLLV